MKAAHAGTSAQKPSALEHPPETAGLALVPVDREPQQTAADVAIFSNLGNLDRLNAAMYALLLRAIQLSKAIATAFTSTRLCPR